MDPRRSRDASVEFPVFRPRPRSLLERPAPPACCRSRRSWNAPQLPGGQGSARASPSRHAARPERGLLQLEERISLDPHAQQPGAAPHVRAGQAVQSRGRAVRPRPRDPRGGRDAGLRPARRRAAGRFRRRKRPGALPGRQPGAGGRAERDRREARLDLRSGADGTGDLVRFVAIGRRLVAPHEDGQPEADRVQHDGRPADREDRDHGDLASPEGADADRPAAARDAGAEAARPRGRPVDAVPGRRPLAPPRWNERRRAGRGPHRSGFDRFFPHPRAGGSATPRLEPAGRSGPEDRERSRAAVESVFDRPQRRHRARRGAWPRSLHGRRRAAEGRAAARRPPGARRGARSSASAPPWPGTESRARRPQAWRSSTPALPEA